MNSLEQGKKIIKDKIPLIGKNPGVYKMLSSTGEILYIGKAKSLKNRLMSYFRVATRTKKIERLFYKGWRWQEAGLVCCTTCLRYGQVS